MHISFFLMKGDLNCVYSKLFIKFTKEKRISVAFAFKWGYDTEEKNLSLKTFEIGECI